MTASLTIINRPFFVSLVDSVALQRPPLALSIFLSKKDPFRNGPMRPNFCSLRVSSKMMAALRSKRAPFSGESTYCSTLWLTNGVNGSPESGSSHTEVHPKQLKNHQQDIEANPCPAFDFDFFFDFAPACLSAAHLWRRL